MRPRGVLAASTMILHVTPALLLARVQQYSVERPRGVLAASTMILHVTPALLLARVQQYSVVRPRGVLAASTMHAKDTTNTIRFLLVW